MWLFGDSVSGCQNPASALLPPVHKQGGFPQKMLWANKPNQQTLKRQHYIQCGML